MMRSVLTSVMPGLLQLTCTLPSPPPCLRLEQQSLQLLHEEHHPAAAAATAAAIDLVVSALVKFMASELPPSLSVLLASGTPPQPSITAGATPSQPQTPNSLTPHLLTSPPNRPVRAEVEKKFSVHGHFTVSTLFISRQTLASLLPPNLQPPAACPKPPSHPCRVVCPFLRGSYRFAPPAAASITKSKTATSPPPPPNFQHIPPSVTDLLHSAASAIHMLVDGRFARRSQKIVLF
jgi:hypothetical protein